MLDKLSADQQFAGEILKVDATPTVFINGERIKGDMSFEKLRRQDQAAVEEVAAEEITTTGRFKPAARRSYIGGCNSPTSQPTSPDFMGSNAIAIFST